MKDKTAKHPVAAFLTSSWTILGAIFLGAMLGKYLPDVAVRLKPIGDGYLNLLRMTVIPIAAAATMASLARLIRDSSPNNLIRRMLLSTAGYCGVLMILALAGAIAFGSYLNPTPQARSDIGRLMFKNAGANGVVDNWAVFEISSRPTEINTNKPIWGELMLRSIPENIFNSLSHNRMVQIIIFFVLFAAASRHMPQKGYEVLLYFFEGVLSAFVCILRWIYLLAALGMACFVASSFLHVDFTMILNFSGFLAVVSGCVLAGIVLSMGVVWYFSRKSLGKVLTEIQGTMVLGVVSGSSLLAMPQAMEAMVRLGFDKRVVNVVIPTGVNLVRCHAAMLFIIASIACANLYDVPLTLGTVVILFLVIPMASLATIGSRALTWYSMLSIPLGIIGVPIGPILVVLQLADSLLDRLMTVLVLATALAITALTKPVSIHSQPAKTQVEPSTVVAVAE